MCYYDDVIGDGQHGRGSKVMYQNSNTTQVRKEGIGAGLNITV